MGKVIVSILFLFAANVWAEVFHVSKSGNDNNPGTALKPFLTIQKAADIMLAGDQCIIHEGVYCESVSPENHELVFSSAENEHVVVSCFEPVINWAHHEGSIYRAQLTWNLDDENQLLFNGEIMNLARWPNKTNFNPFDLEAVWTYGTSTYIAHSTIPALDWANGGIVFFIGKNRWTSWRVPITGSSTGRVNFAELPDTWDFGDKHNPSDGGEFFLQNIYEALDYEGEWYFDRSGKTLYFHAPGSVDPSTGDALFRRYTTAFDLSGKVGIILDGLTIEGGNINLESALECVIKNCRIYYGNHTIASSSAASVRNASISMNDGSLNNLIIRNDIQWGAGNGIVLKGAGNRVDNNHIGNFNYLGSYACPVELRGSNDLTRNQIFNGGRDLVRGGGSGSNCGYNDMHHANLINDDCGAIYFCCGTFGYTRIHHNWIHDISSRNDNYPSYKATGIYLDNSTKQVIVDHNVLWNLEWSCIQINWEGEDLLIYNNTMWSNDQPASASMKRWINGYEIINVPVINNLVNEGELHYTSLSNNCILNLTDDPFEDFANRNFLPKAGTCPVDGGKELPGYTDGYSGPAPDVGAYEKNGPVWIPGPDWEIDQRPSDQMYSPEISVIQESSSSRLLQINNLNPFARYLVTISTDMETWKDLQHFTQDYADSYYHNDSDNASLSAFYRVIELYSPYQPPLPGYLISFDEFDGLAHDTHIPVGTVLAGVPEGMTVKIGGSADGFGVVGKDILPAEVRKPALYVRGDGSGSSFLFSKEIEVVSLWVSAAQWALNNDPGGTQSITGKLNGETVWEYTNNTASTNYFEVTAGSGKLITELIIYPKWVGVDNIRIKSN